MNGETEARGPTVVLVHGGFVGGQRLDEIAGQLNIAIGTVKSRLHRGRAHVRRAYHANAAHWR